MAVIVVPPNLKVLAILVVPVNVVLFIVGESTNDVAVDAFPSRSAINIALVPENTSLSLVAFFSKTNLSWLLSKPINPILAALFL